MGRHYQILLPLFSLFLQRVDLTDLFPLELTVKVLKVYDGDTVLVGYKRQKLKVRLSKLDAPEFGQGKAGRFSRGCLAKLLPIGTSTQLTIYKQDIYRRLLGDLNHVSLKLIQEGCVSLYPHAEFESMEEKYFYLRELQKAKNERRGLWAHGGFQRPKDWRKFNKRNAHPRSHR
ncbi:thermonuclease family protein [Peredibacter sp. HCB2-198]|uniref:thermonuclease family protein n=1 Tax=Peredibacter sp. HCB2-198 TaxID=3383025 RepID=UPI0038B65664